MNCPFCNAVNDDENMFCVSCGKTISQNDKTEANILPPTQNYTTNQYSDAEPDSVETAYLPKQQIPNQIPPNQPAQNFTTDIPHIGANLQSQQKSRGVLYVLVALFILSVVAIVGFAGFYFWQQQQKPQVADEVLPDHLGMFIQNSAKDNITELKKSDIANALEEKEKLVDDGGLPVLENEGSLILYSDSADIPVTELKLIPLDSMEEDGTLKQIEFQAAPIAGKTEMKRLRVPGGVSDGKYVFALLDGFLDEGKHKLWAFEVKNSNKSDNDDIAKTTTIELKNEPSKKDETKDNTKPDDKTETPPKPKPTAKPKVEPPLGARVAYCSGSNVVFRGSPSLNGKKIGKLSKGQRLYVISYSDNYDDWQGTTANWAYVQTESGARGWVFTPFVYY